MMPDGKVVISDGAFNDYFDLEGCAGTGSEQLW